MRIFANQQQKTANNAASTITNCISKAINPRKNIAKELAIGLDFSRLLRSADLPHAASGWLGRSQGALGTRSISHVLHHQSGLTHTWAFNFSPLFLRTLRAISERPMV